MKQLISRLASALLLGAAVLLSLAATAQEYGDIVFERKAAGMDDLPPAVFPHWVHRMQYKCPACHDALFKMKAGTSLVNMDELQAGKWCGACHDGKAAFISDLNSCLRCHYKIQK
jgi:c(7)-type cytochrome triheme protein